MKWYVLTQCQHFRQHRQYNDKLGISSNLSPPFNMLLNILLNRVHPTLSHGTRRSKGLKREGLLQPRHLGHSWTVTMCIWVLKALKSSAPNKPLDWLDPMPRFQNLLAHGTPESITQVGISSRECSEKHWSHNTVHSSSRYLPSRDFGPGPC